MDGMNDYNEMWPGGTSSITGFPSLTSNSGGSSSNSGGNFNLGGAFLGAGLGGLLSNMFGGSPSGAANQYLNQMPGAISPYMQPYMGAGAGALGTLQGQYGNLLNNPGGMLNQIGQGYHQSPGFNFALSQALHGANQASAAGGMAGSPMAQQQNMGLATQLGNQDYYNWLNQARGMYGQGLQGEQRLAGMGMQAGTNMANVLASQLAAQAAMAYQQQQAQNQGIGDIGSALGSML